MTEEERKDDKRPNILSSTLREKSRYIAYKIISEEKIEFNDLVSAVWHSCLNFLGERGTAESNIWIIKNSWDEKEQTGIIKCDHTSVEQIRSSLALISRIGDGRVIATVLGISGTISAAKKKFFGERDLTSFAK